MAKTNKEKKAGLPLITELKVHSLGFNNEGFCEMMAEVKVDGHQRNMCSILFFTHKQVLELLRHSGDGGKKLSGDLEKSRLLKKGADKNVISYESGKRPILSLGIQALETVINTKIATVRIFMVWKVG